MARPLLKSVLLATLLTTLSGAVSAQIYVWTDPSTGKKVYSDQPPPPSAKDGQAKSFGGNVVSAGGLPFAVQDAIKRNPVVLYANKCDFCTKGLSLLNSRGIPFTARNPETEPASAEQLKKLINSMEVPVLTVGTKVLKGYDESAWTAALDAAGYPKTSMKGIKSIADTPANKSSTSGASVGAGVGKTGSTSTGSSSSTSSSGASGAGGTGSTSSNVPVKPPGE